MAGYLYDGSCFICELLVYLQSVVEGTMSLGRPPIVTGVGWKAVSGIVMAKPLDTSVVEEHQVYLYFTKEGSSYG